MTQWLGKDSTLNLRGHLSLLAHEVTRRFDALGADDLRPSLRCVSLRDAETVPSFPASQSLPTAIGYEQSWHECNRLSFRINPRRVLLLLLVHGRTVRDIPVLQRMPIKRACRRGQNASREYGVVRSGCICCNSVAQFFSRLVVFRHWRGEQLYVRVIAKYFFGFLSGHHRALDLESA